MRPPAHIGTPRVHADPASAAFCAPHDFQIDLAGWRREEPQTVVCKHGCDGAWVDFQKAARRVKLFRLAPGLKLEAYGYDAPLQLLRVNLEGGERLAIMIPPALFEEFASRGASWAALQSLSLRERYPTVRVVTGDELP